jgi:hypothetical protein
MYTTHQKIYGYASLRTGHTKSELKENFEKTKLYADYLDIVKSMQDMFVYVSDDAVTPTYALIEDNMTFNPDTSLQVDVITSARDGMFFKLDSIIKQSKPSFDTVLIINSLSAFGNVASIKKYYKIFRKKKIGVLFPDYTRESSLSEYSTFNFAFQPRNKSEYDRAFDLVDRLEDGDLPDSRGRIGKDYSMTFRVAFWLYELFKIPEKTAVAMSGYSKNGFHMKADNYEQTVNYKMELERFDEKYNISNLVKRNRPVQDCFDKLQHWYEKKGSLEIACIHCKVPMIFPIDYKRLVLKAKGGRKELARCIKLYDNDLINRFDEWVALGNEPTDFYNECSEILELLYEN